MKLVCLLVSCFTAVAFATDPVTASSSPAAWAAIAKLPDWSGIWTPDVVDQIAQEKTNPPPWNLAAAKLAAQMYAEEKAGRPRLVFFGCLPLAMPAWMLVNHNALEILFTPGRVTMLGESDGNRLRRIYTDGRQHPADPDPTFHGHSIGRWEGGTLIVDTVAVRPQGLIAVSEAVAIPNNGDMHIVERIHLVGADSLHVDMEITAPRVLTRPWKTTRIYHRQRQQGFDIVEGVCLEGSFKEATDKDGNQTFVPRPLDDLGTPLNH